MAVTSKKRLDDSIAIIAIFLYSFFIAFITEPEAVLALPLIVQFFIVRPEIKALVKRVLKVNILIVITVLILLYEKRYDLALLVFVRANLILTFTMMQDFDSFRLYRALNNLRASTKFSMILFFTAKYIEIIVIEANKLKDSIFLRNFRAKFNLYSFEVYGNLFAMLIIKTFAKIKITEELILIRCKDNTLLPREKIVINKEELILIISILGAIVVYNY
jgi:cobalt/nickel transport system permease protein